MCTSFHKICSNSVVKFKVSLKEVKNIMTKSKSQSQSMAQDSKQSGSPSSECTSTSYKQTVIYTTFLEADSHCFKELVQKHTGASDGEREKLPVTMPARKPSRGGSVALINGGIEMGAKKSDNSGFALMESGIEVGHKKSDCNGFGLIKSGIEMGPQNSDCNGFALIKSGIEVGHQKSDCNGIALLKNETEVGSHKSDQNGFGLTKSGIEMGLEKSNCNGFALIKDGIEVGHKKSDGNGFALIKGGIEMGPQKAAFKLQHRRQFQKRLEMSLGLSNGCVLSPTLNHSPITPLGPLDPFTCSSSSYCHSSYSPSSCSTPSYNQSSYLGGKEEEFYFEASAIRVKSEPELLPLFPLHSPTKPRS